MERPSFSVCVQSFCVVSVEFLQLRGRGPNLLVAPLLEKVVYCVLLRMMPRRELTPVPFPLRPVRMRDVAGKAELARELLGAHASRGWIPGGDPGSFPQLCGCREGGESSSGLVI